MAQSPPRSPPCSESLTETAPTLRALYESYFDLVWRFAANRGVPSSSLEDVVREVFEVVHRQLGGLAERPATRTWVAGVTRNVVRNYLRQHSSWSSEELLSNNELYYAGDLGPAEALERKSPGELLDVILQKMTDLQCEAFILCEIEGLSAVEAAEALYVREDTLRARLRDARKVYNAISARLRAQRFWVAREGGNEP